MEKRLQSFLIGCKEISQNLSVGRRKKQQIYLVTRRKRKENWEFCQFVTRCNCKGHKISDGKISQNLLINSGKILQNATEKRTLETNNFKICDLNSTQECPFENSEHF